MHRCALHLNLKLIGNKGRHAFTPVSRSEEWWTVPCWKKTPLSQAYVLLRGRTNNLMRMFFKGTCDEYGGGQYLKLFSRGLLGNHVARNIKGSEVTSTRSDWRSSIGLILWKFSSHILPKLLLNYKVQLTLSIINPPYFLSYHVH